MMSRTMPSSKNLSTVRFEDYENDDDVFTWSGMRWRIQPIRATTGVEVGGVHFTTNINHQNSDAI